MNISYTSRNHLCLGCGLCEDICPVSSIKVGVDKGEYITSLNESKCLGDKCEKCVKVCPGLGVRLEEYSDRFYPKKENRDNKYIGRYNKLFTGYSNDWDIRYHSASGGMVSQFLIWLLEKGEIDGAVVTKYDNGAPLMTKTFIAKTKEDILDARSSKYGPVTMAGTVKAIKEAQGNHYVVVGLPCHIQGFRKLMAIDKRLSEKIIGLFAIYCSSGRTFYLTEHVMKERGIKREELRYFAYRDEGCLGSMVAITEKGDEGDDIGIRILHRNSETYLSKGVKRVFKDRFQNFYHPLRSFFIPRRCLFCIDHFGELADVCFGDIHIKPYSDDKIGVNSIVVRSKFWLGLLKQCNTDGYITLESLQEEVLIASQKMVYKKKGRNGAFVNLGRKLGWVVPQYDVDYLRQPTILDMLNYLQNRCQQFLGSHKCLWWVISLLKKDTSKLE